MTKEEAEKLMKEAEEKAKRLRKAGYTKMAEHWETEVIRYQLWLELLK